MAEETDAPAPPPAIFYRVWLPLAKAMAWVLLTLLGPFRVRGRYRVPKSRGLLILSNHLADIDPVVIQVACPRHIHFMAKSELFEMKTVGRLIRFFRAFPVRRGEPDRTSVKRAVTLLRQGEAVCVFPEGELSEGGELLPLKPGVALIARMAGVHVICLGLTKTNRIIPYGSLMPRPAFTWVEANWGEVRPFGKETDAETFLGWVDGQLRELTNAS